VNDIVNRPARPAEETLTLATELLGTISAIRRIARRAARLVWQDEPLPSPTPRTSCGSRPTR
jgi:hypothetical protein